MNRLTELYKKNVGSVVAGVIVFLLFGLMFGIKVIVDEADRGERRDQQATQDRKNGHECQSPALPDHKKGEPWDEEPHAHECWNQGLGQILEVIKVSNDAAKVAAQEARSAAKALNDCFQLRGPCAELQQQNQVRMQNQLNSLARTIDRNFAQTEFIIRQIEAPPGEGPKFVATPVDPSNPPPECRPITGVGDVGLLQGLVCRPR